jgi:hypothetical protein
MRASKESCDRVRNSVTRLEYYLRHGEIEPGQLEIQRVLEFLSVARRKLPTESAYERDAQRRKRKARK